MKKYSIIILLSFLMLSTMGFSQGTKSTYFLEGAPFNHQNNPAFYNDLNYFSIPMLGNINISTQSNIGITKFIFPYDDPTGSTGLKTFLHPSVSTEEFLSGLDVNNTLNVNLNYNILAFGFRGFGGFNTFDVNVRSSTYINLPYELFNFLKAGSVALSGTNYQIANLQILSNNYTEVAFGHTHRFLDFLTVGAKVKALVGIGAVDANLSQLDIKMSQEAWELTSNGYLNLSAAGGDFITNDQNAIENFELKTPGPGGYGVAFDLGASAELIKGLKVSAAILDLGSITWNNTMLGATDNEKITFSGFDQIVLAGETDNSDINGQGTQLKDDLLNMANFYDNGSSTEEVTTLNSTINIGVEYEMPFLKLLSVGALYSNQKNHYFTFQESRFFANLSPTKWLDLSANYATTTLGDSFGWVFNFHPKGLNLFVGSDFMITDVSPQYIPLNNLNSSIFFGLNLAMGKRR